MILAHKIRTTLIVLSSLILTLLTIGCFENPSALNNRPGELHEGDYFPLHVGDIWNHRITNHLSGTVNTVLTMNSIPILDSTTSIDTLMSNLNSQKVVDSVLISFVNGNSFKTYKIRSFLMSDTSVDTVDIYYEKIPEGIYIRGESINNGAIVEVTGGRVLKYPLQNGDSWTTQGLDGAEIAMLDPSLAGMSFNSSSTSRVIGTSNISICGSSVSAVKIDKIVTLELSQGPDTVSEIDSIYSTTTSTLSDYYVDSIGLAKTDITSYESRTYMRFHYLTETTVFTITSHSTATGSDTLVSYHVGVKQGGVTTLNKSALLQAPKIITETEAVMAKIKRAQVLLGKGL